MRRHLGWLIATTLLAGGALSACTGIEPGDYKVYRVATTSAKLSDGCYWTYQGQDANVRNDSDTVRSSGTFILFAGQEQEFHLDIGSMTLDGALEDTSDVEVYEFDGKKVDVEFEYPDGNGTKWVTTISYGVEMSVDGALAFGELSIKTSWSCTGNCGEIPPACTETFEFVGTEVEDVDLEHLVEDGGNGGPDSGSAQQAVGVGTGSGSGSGGSTSTSTSGAGGGDTCSSCNEYAQGLTTYGDMCTASQGIADSLSACACGGTCYEVCYNDLCINESPGSECNSCLVTYCYTDVEACYNDVPGS